MIGSFEEFARDIRAPDHGGTHYVLLTDQVLGPCDRGDIGLGLLPTRHSFREGYNYVPVMVEVQCKSSDDKKADTFYSFTDESSPSLTSSTSHNLSSSLSSSGVTSSTTRDLSDSSSGSASSHGTSSIEQPDGAIPDTRQDGKRQDGKYGKDQDGKYDKHRDSKGKNITYRTDKDYQFLELIITGIGGEVIANDILLYHRNRRSFGTGHDADIFSRDIPSYIIQCVPGMMPAAVRIEAPGNKPIPYGKHWFAYFVGRPRAERHDGRRAGRLMDALVANPE